MNISNKNYFIFFILVVGAINNSVLILSTKQHTTFRLIFVQTLFITKNVNKSFLTYHTYQPNIEKKKIKPIKVVPTTCRTPFSFFCFLETLSKVFQIPNGHCLIILI